MAITRGLTQQEVIELFEYDEDIGGLRWRKSRQRVAAGDRAGTLTAKGHVRITVDGEQYLEHKLIWLMFRGEVYSGENVVHIDRDKANNRIDNLELIDRYTGNLVDLDE